jgi:BON domain
MTRRTPQVLEMIGRGTLLRAAALAIAALSGTVAAQEPVRTNAFGDPFMQATRSIAACPVAEGPLVTPEEVRSQAHIRVEKGTTCHYYGRCRLPNAYLYDKEIVPRVVRFIDLDPRFANSTIWVLGQRRWVYLKGCVASAEQAKALEAEVRLIDDVEAVVVELMVGTAGPPPYRTVPK